MVEAGDGWLDGAEGEYATDDAGADESGAEDVGLEDAGVDDPMGGKIGMTVGGTADDSTVDVPEGAGTGVDDAVC